MLSLDELRERTIYEVNDEKRVVVARLPRKTLEYVVKEDLRNFNREVDKILFVSAGGYHFDEGLVAIARCSDEDYFDEEVGMDLAENRLYAKLRHLEYKICDDLIKDMEKTIEKATLFRRKYAKGEDLFYDRAVRVIEREYAE